MYLACRACVKTKELKTCKTLLGHGALLETWNQLCFSLCMRTQTSASRIAGPLKKCSSYVVAVDAARHNMNKKNY